MEARDRPIRDWLSKVRKGEISLPRFQRDESWNNSTREDFLTSVMRELPVGVTLILKTGGDPQFEDRLLQDAPDTKEEVNELLLDGQQRLTTLWKALNDEYDYRTYLLDFSESDSEDSKIEVVGKKRHKKEGKEGLYPKWVDEPERCWKEKDRRMVPLHVLNPDTDTSKDLREWCKKAVGDGDHEELFDRLMAYENKIGRFNIPYLFLEADTAPDVAIEVFIKLNTSFVNLSTFDIVVAQTEHATDKSLREKKEKLKEEVPKLQKYRDVEKFILEAAAYLQNKPARKKSYMNLDRTTCFQ